MKKRSFLKPLWSSKISIRGKEWGLMWEKDRRNKMQELMSEESERLCRWEKKRRKDNRHRKGAWSMSWRNSEMERGSPVHRPLNPVTVSRREESLAAGSHPQSNSNQGSPASACLPPTPHPVTASTFPPTTLLLTGFTYYLTHTRTSHSVSLHTQADG